MEIVAYRAEHLLAISAQEKQRHLAEYLTPDHAKALEKTKAFTAMVDGRPVACGGVLEHWVGRTEAWAHVSEVGPALFRQIHHAVKRFFASHLAPRTEAYVDCNFEAGHRWMRALGFRVECARLEKYLPDGRAAVLYVRIR